MHADGFTVRVILVAFRAGHPPAPTADASPAKDGDMVLIKLEVAGSFQAAIAAARIDAGAEGRGQPEARPTRKSASFSAAASN